MKWIFFSIFFLLLAACGSESANTPQEVKPENRTPQKEALSPKTPVQEARAVEKKKVIQQGKTPIKLDLQDKIEKMHVALMTEMENGLDPQEVAAYAKESELYMSTYGDSLAAEYVFNAGDLYRGIGNFDKALEMWYLVYKPYEQEHPKAPHALFQCGFLYDSILERKDLAKNLYNRFLRKYPEHNLAKDVKSLLENLDKSPEDLIKSFEERGARGQE